MPYWQEWPRTTRRATSTWKARSFAATWRSAARVRHCAAPGMNFRAACSFATMPARAGAGHLLIGPWRHADQEAAQVWVAQQRWPGRRAPGRDGTAPRLQPARTFVTGADEWRDLPVWPPETRPHRWHLHPDGVLAQAAPPQADPDRYTYDPADPTPNLAGPDGPYRPGQEESRSLEARPDVLTYTSAPLAGDLEAAGRAGGDLVRSSSSASSKTDLRPARERGPVGKGWRTSATRRSGAGAGDARQRQPDGTIRAGFICSWPAAHRFALVHLLRLQVPPAAHPRYARNPGTGDPLGTAVNLVPAQQQVFHDPGQPVPRHPPDRPTMGGRRQDSSR